MIMKSPLLLAPIFHLAVVVYGFIIYRDKNSRVDAKLVISVYFKELGKFYFKVGIIAVLLGLPIMIINGGDISNFFNIAFIILFLSLGVLVRKVGIF